MGRGSCTVDEPGRPVGAGTWAGKAAVVVAGAGAGPSRGAVRCSGSSSPGSEGAARDIGFLGRTLVFRCLSSRGKGTPKTEHKIST